MSNLKIKNNKGITLIALIITIIVLLILAIVTIGAIKNDGLIQYAQNAREDYTDASNKEQEDLNTLEAQIGEVVNGGNAGGNGNTGGETEGETGVTKGKIITGSNGIYTETVEDKTLTAIIPVGFCVVKDIEGDANTIERGLVISDVADDDLSNSKGGNQFVWIPVEDYSKFHLIEGYKNGSLHSRLNSTKEAGDTDVAGSPMTNNVVGTTESKAMYKSVKDNKGFYIARFEAGIDAKDESGNQIDNDRLTTKTLANGTVKPLSKKGIGVWNTIPWGGTSAVEASDGLQGNDNADGAVKVAKSMYTKNSKCGVTSTLCYGVQWDAVMNYIDPNYYEGKCTEDSFVRNSSGKGNYSLGLKATGYYEQNHIFDLAGNVYELTMEAYATYNRVSRGGYYDYDGSYNPASYRGLYYPDSSAAGLRFPRSFIFVVLSAVKTKI